MSTNNEQPVSKRQRIDTRDIQEHNHQHNARNIVRDFNDQQQQQAAQQSQTGSQQSSATPDILSLMVMPQPSKQNDIVLQMVERQQVIPTNGATDTIPHPKPTSNDELDNAALQPPAQPFPFVCRNYHQGEYPDLLMTAKMSSSASSTSSSASSPSSSSASSPSTSSASRNHRNINNRGPVTTKTTKKNPSEMGNAIRTRMPASDSDDLDEFHVLLTKQCLCDISEQTLRQKFEGNYYKDQMGIKQIAMLSEWPAQQLMEFLSNIQLLTDIYLKQNAKGQICSRILDIYSIIYHDPNIIDEIFKLSEYNNKFVQFLAGRVIANCLVIAKDQQENYDGWLTMLVANLRIVCISATDPEYVDFGGLQRIHFSLDIILRILEWRDMDEQQLEEALDNRMLSGGVQPHRLQHLDTGADITMDTYHPLPMTMPPIEQNYFSVFYNNDAGTSTETPDSPHSSEDPMKSPSSIHDYGNHDDVDLETPMTVQYLANGCRVQTLQDSESFDTRDLKSNTVCALKNEWSRLVDRMNLVIQRLHSNDRLRDAERIILTYLTLWERIISVQANLSVDSTLPFHEKLPLILKRIMTDIDNIPTSIYKQLLKLFNESLCYGTTLALQSSLPIETTTLANDIFRLVRNQQIFDTLPTRHVDDSRHEIPLIGDNPLPIIVYSTNGFEPPAIHWPNSRPAEGANAIDQTLVQKLVLLILKSVAVSVKVLRSDDSSDSSMDGCSSCSSNDYEAYQEAIQIERYTRDALKKLKRFMRDKLEHHPETHFSKMLVHLFKDQDDYLIEAILCTLDITIAFLSRQPNPTTSELGTPAPQRSNFNELISMLSPVYTFLEFLESIGYKTDLMLHLLVSNETCFLLYLLHFLKYIRKDWPTFCDRCNDWISSNTGLANMNTDDGPVPVLGRTMSVLTDLRVQIERLVLQQLYPYDIKPIIDKLRECESLHGGNEIF